jgi:hypothetical protein
MTQVAVAKGIRIPFVSTSQVRAAVNRRGADLNPSFDPWTFWLSSAAMFVGILVAGLIPW